jgi:tRNA(fMet)-specific endonuclease VapC
LTLFLDANVLIDLLNGRRPQVRSRYEQAQRSKTVLAVSTLVAQEVLYGAEISSRRELQRSNAEDLIGTLDICDFDLDDARACGLLRAQLKRQGNPIGALDGLIAAQALRRGWTVITGNRREFDRVTGLAVIDWSKPPESA